jgi:hypothetical protein
MSGAFRRNLNGRNVLFLWFRRTAVLADKLLPSLSETPKPFRHLDISHIGFIHHRPVGVTSLRDLSPADRDANMVEKALFCSGESQ